MTEERRRWKRHPIRVVARPTGLSRDVLRAWELRYGTVLPARRAGGQRLCSDDDIDRLRLIQQALEAGRRIGQVVTPLTIQIGDLWWGDHLSPAHERLATSVVRRTLDEIRVTLQNGDGPGLVVATPAGQHHEIGAMLAAANAAAAGGRAIHMGADLPAASIAKAAELTGAGADTPALRSALELVRVSWAKPGQDRSS